MAQEAGLLRGVEVPDFLRDNALFIAGVIVVEALLAWLTATEQGLDWRLLTFVLVVAAAYGAVGWTSALTRAQKENLHFLIVAGGVVGILGILSSWAGSYLVFIFITVLIFGLFALGLNLEFGYTGIINFGHVAFMGIGAYVTTLVTRQALTDPYETFWTAVWTGLAEWLAALAALAVVGAAVAALVGGLASLALPENRTNNARKVGLAVGAVAGVAAAWLVLATVRLPVAGTWDTALVVAGSVIMGMVAAALFGLLIGIPTLRLREDYLAIVTIGAAEIIRRSWLNEVWLTDGPRGVVGFPLPFSGAVGEWAWLASISEALGVDNVYKTLLLIMVLAAIALVFLVYEALVRSPYGRVLKAIREDEEVAQALGKNVFTYKLQALALGSAVAAIAGALFAWQNVYINPDAFEPIFTFYAWIIIVLGGIGNNKGTILGALILFTFFEATRFLNLDAKLGLSSTQGAAFRVVLIGVLLIVFMMFKPEGILGRKEEMVLGD